MSAPMGFNDVILEEIFLHPFRCWSLTVEALQGSPSNCQFFFQTLILLEVIQIHVFKDHPYSCASKSLSLLPRVFSKHQSSAWRCLLNFFTQMCQRQFTLNCLKLRLSTSSKFCCSLPCSPSLWMPAPSISHSNQKPWNSHCLPHL